MNSLEYWEECISIAAEECDLELTPEQLECLAKSVEGGHECYGMAFYSPPPSDRDNDIEREWKEKYRRLEELSERRIAMWKTEACRVARVDESRVYENNGEIWVK